MSIVKPSMAYPNFASATYTFEPNVWPSEGEQSVSAVRYEADGRTAGGSFVRQTSALKERVITISYRKLTVAERDSFASIAGTGFFYDVGGETFEYRHLDDVVYKVRFLNKKVVSSQSGYGRYDLSSIDMVIVG